MPNSTSPTRPVRFGPFELDLRAGELLKAGVRIKLQDQPLQFLAILLENPGQVVTREELRRRLWPADTFVDFEHGLNKAIHKIREALGDSSENPRFVETLPRRGYRFIAPVNRFLDSSWSYQGHFRDSIAVFPLANPEADPEADYLASGIPESILHTLSPLPNLSVIAGRAVPPTADRERDAEVIGRKFKVRAALRGRLLQRRTRLRLQVDLLDTTNGKQLWADQCDRDFSELFVVQENIVKEVSQQLRLDMTGQANRLTKRYTENAEAYRLYLRGRHSFENRSMEGFQKALAYFQNAIQLDPRYALGYAGVAATLYLPGYYGAVHPEGTFPSARAAAEKALELDSDLAEAHEALGTLNLFGLRWKEAEQEYKRGLEINPNHSLTHSHYALCLCELGRFQEGIAEAMEAQALDPLSASTNACLGWSLWAAGQYEKALEQSLVALELDPHSMFVRVTAGLSYEQNRMYKEAISEFQRGIDLSGGSIFLGFQGHTFALSGDKASAWNNIHKLERLSKERYAAPTHLAIAFAGLGEKDLAIRALEQAYQNHDSFLIFARMLPQFENLHSDPRFQDLVRRMNFPED